MNKQTHHNPMTETELDTVLSLFESGVSPEDIIKKFSGHKEEIVSVLRMMSAIARDADSVTPSKEFLASVLEHVTQTAPVRYSKRGVFSSITSSLMYTFDVFSLHARIALPAVAFALLLVIFVANRPNDPAGAPELSIVSESAKEVGEDGVDATQVADDSAGLAMKSGTVPQMMAMKVAPPATGNADDAISAFSESFSEEEAILAAGDGDIAAFIADDGANVYQNFYEKEL
ncbi:MAG: hypothetical protein EXS68_03120 [Candidatus Ryanbacteria bacterium]|nr:hypothetical protein [Candidatus Ryanbacteria bacterium]